MAVRNNNADLLCILSQLMKKNTHTHTHTSLVIEKTVAHNIYI